MHSRRKRAKRNTLNNTTSIWQYFRSKKPKFKIRPEHAKRTKQHSANFKKQRNEPLREITQGTGGFEIIGKKKSTSTHKTTPPKSKIFFKIHSPSVTDYFSIKKNNEELANRFGNASNH